MTAKEARAKNLALLVKTKAGGKQRLFAERFGFDASHVSQMINGLTMGDNVARKIEQIFEMERGAMDRPPAELDDAPEEQAPEKEVELTEAENDAIRAELQDYWKHLRGATKRKLLADAKAALAADLQRAERVNGELRKRLGMTGSATDRRVEEMIGQPPGQERRQKSK